MSVGAVAAIVSFLIPLACIGWNMGWPKSAMQPLMERLATSVGVASGAISLTSAMSVAVLALGAIGLLLSAGLLALTFFSRLPSQRPAIAVGEAASDFALTTSEGDTWRLSGHAGNWIVLKFYRGYWCPYCVRDLHDWEEVVDDLRSRLTEVIAISPDRVDELHSFKKKTGLRMTLLADPENEVIRRYNLQNRNFTPKRGPFRELVIPTTLLIDDHGVVRLIDQATDFRVRRPLKEIMERIDALLPGAECEVCALPADKPVGAPG